MSPKEAKTMSSTIPQPVKVVLIKIVILFGAWLLLYPTWLKPLGIPDTQLTQLVTAGTHWVLSFFYDNVQAVGSSILLNDMRVILIGDRKSTRLNSSHVKIS